jgi:hypothetical protein
VSGGAGTLDEANEEAEMNQPFGRSARSESRGSPADPDPLREQLSAIRADVLARAERRFRGLTASERRLLESTTAQLVDELLRAFDGEAT